MIPSLETAWLWGLVGDDEAAALWSPEAHVAGMVAFEAALTRAMGEVGRVDAAKAEAVARAIETATPDLAAIQGAVAKDGVPVSELVRQLRAAVGADAKLVHTGATSQDVVDTATVLILEKVTGLVAARLTECQAGLLDLEDRFGARPLMGRTRMQAAVPMTVRDRLETWRLPLEAHAAALAELRPRVERVQLGGAVGDNAAFGDDAPAMVASLARHLGLGAPQRAWHAMRAPMVEYGHLMGLISGTLGKVGQDVALMAQQGIQEVSLSGGGGSSAMPHKQNPVLAELLVTLARFNAVQVGGLHQAMVHEQERSGTSWTLEWMILPQICVTTCRALAAARDLFNRIERLGEA